MDINVYIDNVKNISREKYEDYIKKFNMESEIHPEVNFEEHTGFLPFKIEVNIDFLKDKKLLTGFEYSSSLYNLDEEKSQISKKPKKGLAALFKKKEVTTNKEYLYNEQIDDILSKCMNNIMISFKTDIDSFELRTALSFASFLVETCNGTMYNCYNGTWYKDNIYEQLLKEIKYHEKDFSESNIKIHEFEKWI